MIQKDAFGWKCYWIQNREKILTLEEKRLRLNSEHLLRISVRLNPSLIQKLAI